MFHRRNFQTFYGRKILVFWFQFHLCLFPCAHSTISQHLQQVRQRLVVERIPNLSLHWRHDGRDGVSNHQLHDCLLNCLFRRRSKKISKIRVTGLCAGNSPVTGKFPTRMASNAENGSIWWSHHVYRKWLCPMTHNISVQRGLQGMRENIIHTHTHTYIYMVTWDYTIHDSNEMIKPQWSLSIELIVFLSYSYFSGQTWTIILLCNRCAVNSVVLNSETTVWGLQLIMREANEMRQSCLQKRKYRTRKTVQAN